MRKIVVLLGTLLLVLSTITVGDAVVLFQDDFNDGNYNGWTQVPDNVGNLTTGAWTIQDGALQCTTSYMAQNILLDNVTLPNSYVLEFDYRTVQPGGGMSLMAFYTQWFGWSPTATMLSQGYRPGRIYINETVNSIVHLDYYLYGADAAGSIDPGLWHHFKYIQDGTAVSLYFADKLIYSVDLPIGLSGGGLVLSGCPGIQQFDNILITTPAPVPVTIDIKPGSDTNCFNQNDRGVIPVAILGSESLDVNQINVNSLRLEGLAVKMVGKSGKLLAHYEDVNADGYLDLVVQFQDSDGWVYSGSGPATLTGQLSNGTPIQGSDSICIVP